jgi:glyoxylase-like metal-dependent hydrolase (beta-lactamase superfamily II)
MRTGAFHLTIAAATLWAGSPQQAPDYEVRAIRYATVADFPVSGLVRGADPDERLDIAMVFWLIQSPEHTILFDTGFHRPRWFDRFAIRDFVSPDEAVQLAGVTPGDVTDVIISHAHWDHMGGIDLFPNATIWIQAEEFAHYTGAAWQNGGRGGGADADDVVELVRRNTLGQVHFVDGDDVEIFPGIRAFTGARHTYASQYLLVAGRQPLVLASDNAYLYRNLVEHRPVATFTPADSTANLAALTRMLQMAGDVEHVVPGHDPAQFERFPTEGRVARIR